MKRKHDALFNGHTGHGHEDAQHSFAHSKIGQYLRGQDLLTESVLWYLSAAWSEQRRPKTDMLLVDRVKHLGALGWGLVAKQQIRRGSLVLEFMGKPCSTLYMKLLPLQEITCRVKHLRTWHCRVQQREHVCRRLDQQGRSTTAH